VQHRGIIEFFILESGYANGFVIEQEEKENPLSLPVQDHIAIREKFLQNTNCIPNLKAETNEEPTLKGLPTLKPGTLHFCYS